MSAESQRYTAVAIVLHWAIALAIVGQILLGWWMGDALDDAETQAQAIAAYQLHKSIGLTVLALSIVRLIWRLTHKPPPYPDHMPPWEKTAARVSHWAFYVLMIALPMTGWLYVSAGWLNDRPLNVPTLYFGLFQVPHLFGLAEMGDGVRAGVAAVAEFFHSKMAWVALVLLALHAGAALKHHFWDKDAVLTHMVPGLKPLAGQPAEAPPERGRNATLILGFGVIVLAFAALAFAFVNPPGSAPTAPPADVQEAGEAEPAPVTDLAAPVTEATVAAPATPSAPAIWTVDRGASAIRFSGTHAGNPFEGQFSRWRGDIRFDADNLDASRAVVTIETGSASDGVALHDQSLPQAEWFNVAQHPTAIFRTTRIRHRDGNQYEARGTLTLKGRDLDIDLPFTLTINGDRAVMEGRAVIRRDEADLGQLSDPGNEFVSREIVVSVHVEATRSQ